MLIGESEGKSSIGKLRGGWENKFEVDIKCIRLEIVDWIYLD
jgi:hypothetical protein